MGNAQGVVFGLAGLVVGAAVVWFAVPQPESRTALDGAPSDTAPHDAGVASAIEDLSRRLQALEGRAGSPAGGSKASPPAQAPQADLSALERRVAALEARPAPVPGGAPAITAPASLEAADARLQQIGYSLEWLRDDDADEALLAYATHDDLSPLWQEQIALLSYAAKHGETPADRRHYLAGLVRVLLAAKRFDQARAVISELSGAAGLNALQVRLAHARVADAEGRPKEARRLLRSVTDDASGKETVRAGALWDLAADHQGSKEWTPAEKLMREYERRFLGSSDPKLREFAEAMPLQIAHVMRRAERWDAMDAELDRVVERFSGRTDQRAEYYLGQVRILRTMRKDGEGQRRLRELMKNRGK